MKKVIIALGLSAILITSCFAAQEPLSITENSTKEEVSTMEGKMVIIKTTYGDIEIELYPEVAPLTVENFLKLTRDGFYDGLKFHRVIKGFVAQGGDPQTKGEEGKDWTLEPEVHIQKKLPLAGTGGPGYTIKAEFNEKKHLEGTLSMARSAHPDSAGSQFYICLAPQPHLDNNYTVFGQVTKGLDLVHKIKVGDEMIALTIVEKEKTEIDKEAVIENSTVE